MAKKLIHNYVFSPSTNSVTINYIFKPERLLLINNVTRGITIYIFNEASLGFTSVNYNYQEETTTVVLDYNCVAMSVEDKLQIFVEADSAKFEPDETFIDPVSKFRVSQPENLIDTDFEYGLQSTKWETLELVKNIPTFFSRSGDNPLTLAAMETIEDSDVVSVTTAEDHELLSGSPVIIIGSKSITCDGSFIVTTVVSNTIFLYKSKALQTFTGSIKDDYTLVYPGSVYQGTEFDLTGIDTIVTDGSTTSTLTVNTRFPTLFTTGTSFFLTNSVARTNIYFNASSVVPENYDSITKVTTNNTATTETNDFALGAVQPYNYTGIQAVYFNSNSLTVNTTIESIIFPTPHQMTDNTVWMYVPGEGNTVIGGLAAYQGYYVRVVSSTEIYLTTVKSGTTRVNLSSSGTNGGIMRSAFIKAYRSTTANTTSETVTFDEDHGLTADSSVPLLFFNGVVSNLTVNADLMAVPTIYYAKAIPTTSSLTFSSTPAGGVINLTSATATGLMVKARLLQNNNSMYFGNHGLVDDSVITFTVISGAAPTGLASGNNYKAEVVDTNRIRFKVNDTGSVINLTSAGTNTSTYQILAKIPNLSNDSIYAKNHLAYDSVPVVYNSSGGTPVEGLTDGTTYYVFQKSQDYFKLATTSAGWQTAAITVSSSNVATNVLTTAVAHGFTTGKSVQYLSATPVGGLVNGGWYWVRSQSSTTVSLHWTKAGAVANNDYVDITTAVSGSNTLREANLVDITSVGSGIQSFSALQAGASDGVYTLIENISDTQFTMVANNQVLSRSYNITQKYEYNNNAFYIEDHGFVTSSPVDYTTTGVAYGGLSDDTTYYVIRISRHWIRLAETANNATLGTAITITNNGSGVHTIVSDSVSGEVEGVGTISLTTSSNRVTGAGTNFPAMYSPGDQFIVYRPEITSTKTITSINTGTDLLTCANHGLITGDSVRMSATLAPTGTSNDMIYYARTTGLGDPTNTFTLYPTYNDAVSGTNIVDLSSTGDTVRLLSIAGIGATLEFTINYVNSKTELVLTQAAGDLFNDLTYAVGTGLYVRADGFALHRPYDGGVELIPSTNPDSQMIRQTRKYFRYQSGKGIQVSFAVNFKPTVSVDTLEIINSEAYLRTRYPHRLSVNLVLNINGAQGPDASLWNGEHTVTEVVDQYTVKINISSIPTNTTAGGLIEYYVKNWQNSRLKCGFFDDQNGLYFEYDGQDLYCVRRSSVRQLSGTSSVTFKSGLVSGINTKFSSQLLAGDKIVIKGQTYLVTKISSNTSLYILPSYRGESNQNVIITKTEDTKVKQSDWSIDPCDGTGPLGFYLNLNRIQMAYMDYSWYGAGKVRFGFKNQDGQVKYAHEFVHNNKFTEAYMRSGNLPARYEIENLGRPTYVPALAHWGTSVIMDGRFDDDKAYVFTAGSNTISITGSTAITLSARVETTQQYFVRSGGQYRQAGFGLLITTPSATFNSIPSGIVITGTGIQANTRSALPINTLITPRQPYLASVDSYFQNLANVGARNLLIIDRQPTTVAAGTSTYSITLSTAATPIVYNIPLISIRLSPSVDNGSPGALGQREIINRMQLILTSVGILSTHSAEISLRLNGQINNNSWQRVTNPSLSQLIYHEPTDSVSGGTVVYSFRAQGGTGATARTPTITSADLGDIATLGNSIMGGDGIFPDGPDVLTVVARLVEDPSTVSSLNPFSIAGRISWSESQA